ncbi:hypothetical protein V474_02590 [Novosphingobium barchaimii LL02]|uniref:TonB-denpendent receptor n=1 Tax=Novosphingobium barchaimii LL02 TaxID=1114963 RepID=A0A0J7XLH2_9SPHN|nr:TonB-dependent receptor [Novosphingobium barchaimii]KMS51953.1 hypothetical protein V474_02590 [Novosphingobium barchaimii LL02]
MNNLKMMGITARTMFLTGLMTGAAPVAMAQESETRSTRTGDGVSLEDIIVTARKFEERLQDAPVSVTTVTGETLEKRGIRDLSEITKLASSMKFDSDADVRAGVSIRGVGQSSDVNAAPGVGMFIDGVYQPSSAFYTVPFFDAQRIEVLKGPQGTLYGKNTMGGAISIVSRDPTDTLGGDFMVEGSSGPQIVANAAVNLPIAGEEFGNRTSVFYRYSEGLQKNRTTGENANERRDFAVRSKFVARLGGLRSMLSLFHADLQSAPFAYSTTNLGLNDPIDNVTKDINGKIVSKYTSVNFTNSLELGDTATITSLSSYDHANVDTLGDADFTGVSALRVSGLLKRDTYAQELRLASSPASGSALRWLVGGYYSDDKIRSDSLSEARFPVVGFRPLSVGAKAEDGNNYAGFGQATLSLGDLELVGGLRYDRETRTNVSSEIGLAGVTRFDERVVSKAWQPKVSASYHFAPEVMVYGLVARGFRAGGFNALTAPAAFRSYQPEKTTNYEAGLKSEFFDRRVRLNVAGFYTDYSDILQSDIFLNPTGGQTVVSRNGGKARSYGVELDGAWRVTKGFTLTGGYTYLDIRNKEIPLGQIRRRVSSFSPHTFNVQADFVQDIAEDWSIAAHASANYIGRTPIGTEVEWRDAHTLVDASFDINYANATLTIFGKNIFDEKYYTSFIPRTSTALRTSALGLLNRGAEYGVRLSAHF